MMELDTPRLRLRPWRDDDLANLIAMNAAPEVNAWLGGPGLAERSPEVLRLMQTRLQEQGWGVLRVEDRAGAFLGLAGLQPVGPKPSDCARDRSRVAPTPCSMGRGYA
jgi:RimJ/RimL family protein N-acetyltransferase